MLIHIQKKRRRLFSGLLAAVVCAGGLCAPLAGCGRTVSVTIHVGDLLPDSVRLLGDDATSHIDGIEDDRATRAGVYEVPVQADSGKSSIRLRLKVIDRVAPVVTPRHVSSALAADGARCRGFHRLHQGIRQLQRRLCRSVAGAVRARGL